MVLGMGCGGADVGEDVVTLVVVLVCVREGTMAWVVERLDGWCVTGSGIGSGIPSAVTVSSMTL